MFMTPIEKQASVASDKINKDPAQDQDVTWSSRQAARTKEERRANHDRRQLGGRVITVPDMRLGHERRNGDDRRKVRLTITGRAIDV